MWYNSCLSIRCCTNPDSMDWIPVVSCCTLLILIWNHITQNIQLDISLVSIYTMTFSGGGGEVLPFIGHNYSRYVPQDSAGFWRLSILKVARNSFQHFPRHRL